MFKFYSWLWGKVVLVCMHCLGKEESGYYDLPHGRMRLKDRRAEDQNFCF